MEQCCMETLKQLKLKKHQTSSGCVQLFNDWLKHWDASSSNTFALSLCECEKFITLVWVEKIICFVTSAPQTVLYNRYKWLAIHELYKTLWREKKTSFSHRIKNLSHVICSSFPIIHVKRRKNRRKSFSNFLPSNLMTN